MEFIFHSKNETPGIPAGGLPSYVRKLLFIFRLLWSGRHWH